MPSEAHRCVLRDFYGLLELPHTEVGDMSIERIVYKWVYIYLVMLYIIIYYVRVRVFLSMEENPLPEFFKIIFGY